MRCLRLLVFGLLLSAIASTVAQACSCIVLPRDTLMREGHTVARVFVLQQESETGSAFGTTYYTTSLAHVQESFSGPFPSNLIEIWSSYSPAIGCDHGSFLRIGRSEMVVLDPSHELENVYVMRPCIGYALFADDAEEVIESYAAMREQGDGIWIDTIAFIRLIKGGSTLAELQQAFPEVEIIAHDTAPPELQVHWEDYILAEVPPGLDEAFASHRTDQSRFVARMRDGVVVGGEFR